MRREGEQVGVSEKDQDMEQEVGVQRNNTDCCGDCWGKIYPVGEEHCVRLMTVKLWKEL